MITTILLIYIAGVILAYILGAIWNDYLIKWFKLDKYIWEIYPIWLCLFSLFTVFIWIFMLIFALIPKIPYLGLTKKPTFKRKH